MPNFLQKLTSTELETDSKGRIYFFDSMKFCLILLVVIAHFTYPGEGIGWFYKGLASFVITVPMPVFIFVTGFFSKSIIDKRTGRFKFERILQFLILYVFMTLVIFLINYYLLQNTSSYKFFQPMNPAWYLWVCIFWYALIPVIHPLKPKYVMIGSIICALLIGMDPMVGDFMALERIVCFFPIFIAGYYVSQEQIEKLLKFGGNKIRVAALIFLVAFLIFCLWDPLNYASLKHIISPHYAYKIIPALGPLYDLTGPIARLGWYALSGLIIIAFMYVVPRYKTFYTKLGTRTLQIFIWHSILVRLFRYFGLYTLAESSNNIIIQALPLIIAVALTFILAWKPFGIPFDWVLKQRFAFLFKSYT